MNALEISQLSSVDKLGAAMERSLQYLPDDAKSVVKKMVEPESLAIIGGTLIVWVGSHAFGVGELVDVVLLVAGVFTLGFSVFEGGQAFIDFTSAALGANSESDLDQAGKDFAKAVTLLGIGVIQAFLLRGQSSAVMSRGLQPKIYPLPNVGLPPGAGRGIGWSRPDGLNISRPASIPGGSLGGTTAYGSITIARNQTLTEQRITLFHELVHRYFSPRFGPFRRFRAQISFSAYERVALLRYIEEALAEGYGQLMVHGLAKAVGAIRFPISGGYVTVSQLAQEGSVIGTIVLGGSIYTVSISMGNIN